MSISPAQNSSSAAIKEPLKSLLETIRRAQTLADVDAFEPRPNRTNGGDPLAGLRQTMAAEAAHQSQTAPTQWYPEDEKSAAIPDGGAVAGKQPTAASAAPVRTSAGAGSGQGAEALVGREVLAMLREKPLPGPARAAAVELLVAQISADPDPSALREVLAILVTGQSD